MAISFNGKPYYDDFDPSKNFHRVLFKPGFAVQSRELTQVQTILQHQISSFADNIFAKNTPVSGGNITVDVKCYYLKLNNLFNTETIVAENFKNRIITDSTGTILAKVVATAEATGTDVVAGDPPTLIVTYFSGEQFTDGMMIIPTDGSNYRASTIGSIGGQTCSGKSSIASISEGTFYVRNGYFVSSTVNEDGTNSKYSIGHFVVVNPQTIILDKYSNTPTYRVGLNITETVEDYIGDPSLLDPALGASNYQAPGADRYQIKLILDKLPTTLGNDDNYIELILVDSGNIIRQVNNTVYSTINDYIAKRTYDTNGDFIVNDFSITPIANTINSNNYDLKIGKGVAFVSGYRVENQSEIKLTNQRSRTTENFENNYVSVDYGSYFYVSKVKGVFDVTISKNFDLHLVGPDDINTSNTLTYKSTLVGSGYIRGLEYDTNTTDSDTESYVFKAYLHDIATNSLSGDVASATASTIVLQESLSLKLSDVTDAYVGVQLSIDSGTGAGFSTNIVGWNSTTKTATVSPNFVITPDSTSKFSLRFGTKNVESLINATPGTYAIASSAEIDPKGKQGNSPTGSTILQNPGVPELIFPIGNPYVAEISDSSYSSTRMFRNYTFGISGAGVISLAITLPSGLIDQIDFAGGTGALSADAIKENYTIIVTSSSDTANNGDVGSVLDFCTSGNTVSISSDKNTLTLTSTKYKTPLTVSIISKVNVNNADATDRFLKQKTLVTGNLNTVSYAGPSGTVNTYTKLDLENGQVYVQHAGLVLAGNSQSLYISDVKSISKIIDTGSPATAPTLAMLTDSAYNVTNSYEFNNGQKDSIYDHSSIKLRPGAPQPKGNILIVLNYYSRSAADGYFSIESYLNETYSEIPKYTARNGKVYNLRDCIDFRPTRKNAQADFVVDTGTNPATTDGGYFIPQDLSNWVSDYQYYLARKDKLVLTKDGSFQVLKGNPDIIPSYPIQPDGSLLLSYLNHDPYTALLPSEAPKGVLPNLSVEKVSHKRWAMADISDLQTRINNIEYYSALNLLEQNAQSLQITDANGLNRFKNGILVDDFSTYGVADTANPDYSASIDRLRKRMTALQLVDNYPLKSAASLKALGIPGNSGVELGYTIGQSASSKMFCLPYTSDKLVEQKLASEQIKANPFNSNVLRGTCTLNPPLDNWVDGATEPDILLVDPNLNVYRPGKDFNLLNSTNWQTIPGTLYNTAKAKSTIIGSKTASSKLDTSNLGSGYDFKNGYITDSGIQPYIRAQEIIFRAKGLKTNTPVNIFFDGTHVNKYIVSSNILELQNCTGKFEPDDVIGYTDTDDGLFYPFAAVVSVYVYPGNSTKQRLYLTGDVFTDVPIKTTTVIKNGKFDDTGQYVAGSSTATGKSIGESSETVKVTNAGTVAGVGGTYTDITGNTMVLTAITSTAWNKYKDTFGPFLNQYGVWDILNSGASKSKLDASYYVSFPETGTYTFKTKTDNYGDVYFDGVKITDLSSNTFKGPIKTKDITVTAGNHLLRFTGTNSDGPCATALIIWNKNGDPNKLIFDTRTPPEISPVGSGEKINMPEGGAFYTGVTKVNLGDTSSDISNYYVGAKINFNSIYLSRDQGVLTKSGNVSKEQQVLDIWNKNKPPIEKTTYTDSAVITAWDNANRIATLDTPVRISQGFNNYLQTSVNSTFSVEGSNTIKNYSLSVTQGSAPSLSTNESGEICGIFQIPSSTFRAGIKSFYIDNRTTLADPKTATTWAEGTFVAGSVNYKTLDSDYSPSLSSDAISIIQSQEETFSLIGIDTALLNNLDPVAQTFIIDKTTYPDGSFLNSIRLFFKSKPTTTTIPVKISISPTENGVPSGKTLDYSIVSLSPDKVKVSSTPHYLDASSYTEFKFDFPVYIKPETKYAIVVESASADYSLYIAAQNSTAIPSTVKANPTDPTPTTYTKITSVPYVGALYQSQNSGIWKGDETKSLMFVINKCVFNTNYVAKIPFVVPKNTPAGQKQSQILSSFYDGIQNDTQGVLNGTKLIYQAFNVTTTDYIPAKTSVDYSYSSTLKSTETLVEERSITPGRYASPSLDNTYLEDGKGSRVLIPESGNSFIMFATLKSSDPNMSPFISDDGLRLYVQTWGINDLRLYNENIVLKDGGSGYDAANTTVTIGAPTVSGGTQAYAEPVISGGIIQSIEITTPGSGYLYSPSISISDSSVVPGTGADAEVLSEFSPNGGNGIASYVTKRTTLTPGNDSGDLRVFFTAYRPLASEIYVFYKIRNREDVQPFDENSWQLMTYVNNTGNGYSLSKENVLEFELSPGELGIAANKISYTNKDGTNYSSFNEFSIKVVMTASDTTYTPFLTDLRVLALPPGTGF